ncbi:MAG: hypothetical protein OXH66_08855 [Gemmatimonadetes bacterium]|nr:hypothetical protein [Gemmatimonadota bacterium]
MARELRVGAARIDLVGSAASFQRATRRGSQALKAYNAQLAAARRQVVRWNQSASRMVRNVTSVRGALTTIAGAGGLGLLARSTAASAAQLDITADKLGVTVEELQRLRFAAGQFNVDARQVDNALQRFTRRTGEAARGAGVLAEEFKRQGIELRDAEGNLRPTFEILGDYADAIGRTTSQQEKLLLAFRAFDREGAALVTLFQEGGAAAEALGARLDELGGVVTGDLTQAARRLDDLFGEIAVTLRAGLTRSVLENAAAVESFARAVQTLALSGIDALGRGVQALSRYSAQLGAGLGAVVGFLAAGRFVVAARAIGVLTTSIRAAAAATATWGAVLAAAGGPLTVLVRLGGAIAGAAVGLVGLRTAFRDAADEGQRLSDTLDAMTDRQLEQSLTEVNAKIVELARVQRSGNFITERGTELRRRQFGELIRTRGALEAQIRQRRELTAAESEAAAVAERQRTAAENRSRALEVLNRQYTQLLDGIRGVTAAERARLDALGALSEAQRRDPEIVQARRRVELLEALSASIRDRTAQVRGLNERFRVTIGLITTPIEVNLSAQRARNSVRQLSTTTSELRPVLQSVGQVATRLFADVVSGARNATDALRDLGRAFASIVAEEAARGLVRALASSAGIPSFQSGGIARPGLALVGEAGPELVDFRRTARVYDASRTAGLLAGGSGVTIEQLNITGVRDAYDVRRIVFESLPEIADAVDTIRGRS